MTRTKRPDAPRINIVVSKEIIKDSKRADSSHCMIAEAVKLAYPGAACVSVDISTIRFSDRDKGLRYVYLTPRTAQKALVDFDSGINPEPFAFQLRHVHVTSAGRRRSGDTKKGIRSAAADSASLARAGFAGGASVSPMSSGALPRRIGGKTPPRMPHTRREFGVRAFGVKFNLPGEKSAE